MDNKGVYLKVLEEEHISGQSDAYKYGGAAIADIECVLKDEAEVLMAPSAIVFENTDDTIPEETVTDNSFLSVNKEIIFKNVNTADVVAVSAEMGSTRWLGPDWIVANCYHRTNRTEGLEFQLQAHTTKSTHGIYCVFILLTQRGSDLCAKVICSGYPAITACRAYQENIGYRFHYDNGGGTPVDLLDTMNTDSYENINPHKMAVRNLSITYRPRKRVVAVYDDCIMKEWVKLWPDTRLSDIEHGIAMMGGHGAGSVWLNVLSYLPEEITDVFYYNSNITKRYYQAQKGTSVRSIRVGFRQQDDDVWAKVYAVTYKYPNPFAFPLDGLKDDEYKSAIANTVDGKSEDANIENTLSLCGLSAVRQARVRHTVTVDPSFNASKLPVRLHEVCLDVSVPADATEALTDKISGYSGAIAKTGAGTLSLDTDICGSMDLEVLSGTVSVASPREIAGKLIVANGATLSFDFTSEEQAYIGAQNASFAPGATVCVKLPDLPTGIEDGTMIKIIKGCELAPESISGVRFALQGGNGQVKAGLTVDADGDIAVLFRTVGGLIISIR